MKMLRPWRGVLLLPFLLALAGCDYFMDSFFPPGMGGAEVEVYWNIESLGGDDYEINESHDRADGNIEVTYTTGQFSSSGGGTGGSIPSPFPHDLPYYMFVRFFGIFAGINTNNGASSSYFDDNVEPCQVTYSTSHQSSVEVPYAVSSIHGTDVHGSLDANDLISPGTLSVVDVAVDSDNEYLDGSGMIVFHNGNPSGIVYMVFYHSNGYVTPVYQWSGSASSGQFFGEMENEFRWSMFVD